MKKHLSFILIALITTCTSFAQNTIGGIGAQLMIDTAGGYTMPRIMSLVQGSPAYDKLKATDFIMSVNGTSCKNKTIEDVVAMIRGVAGTTVHITVADTKQGGRPREYDLIRVAMQVAGPPDPVPAFNTWCENDLAQLKKNGFEIIKTFPSDCGNYFFNFDAEAGGYHIRVYSMEEKGTDTHTPGYSISAKVFDASNEPAAIQLTPSARVEVANTMIARLDGSVTFHKDCVANVAATIDGNPAKCKAMYIVVYR
jgi:hypothetical protein